MPCTEHTTHFIYNSQNEILGKYPVRNTVRGQNSLKAIGSPKLHKPPSSTALVQHLSMFFSPLNQLRKLSGIQNKDRFRNTKTCLSKLS